VQNLSAGSDLEAGKRPIQRVGKEEGEPIDRRLIQRKRRIAPERKVNTIRKE
jgi:hypothetical protein